MSKTIIQLEGVFKRYPMNEYRPSLRHEASRMLGNLLWRSAEQSEHPTFWALENISLAVKASEAIGIVGRNGAGKTTLLRVLSHITQPTRESVHVQGRIVPLIGLGAGFDMERSGRENIFLSAAIYGLSAKQTSLLLNTIVEFAELGDFIHRPVKIYSSGMLARLGFSIAVHLKPDIIFLDEVFSVGDQAFQDKCKVRIHELKAQGSTILMVTHYGEALTGLCERTVWLHEGRLMMDGVTEDVLEHYNWSLPAR